MFEMTVKFTGITGENGEEHGSMRGLLKLLNEAIGEDDLWTEQMDGTYALEETIGGIRMVAEIAEVEEDEQKSAIDKVRVGIEMSSGCVTAVHCSQEFDYELFDWDDLGDCPKAEAKISHFPYSG